MEIKNNSIDDLIEYIRYAMIPPKYCVGHFNKGYNVACNDILEKVQELKANCLENMLYIQKQILRIQEIK